ncbi:putative methylase [Gordonia phage GMA2]|uniref:Putative methylase n=1 Tax=Gordonia phage GMA2 TaxID=1647283 RepID=A0A0K0N6M6_9CAUD|nr:putative methylase [Gordonia phage GMA2]AKJ72589.1 putative methylase [Gordonia phage GMA2]
MSVEILSVNGLGGGMELGVLQSNPDFELIHRTGSLDLGSPVVEANRKLMGWDWESNHTADQKKWRTLNARVIVASPPCSAWSTLTRKDLRGADAKVMQCTDEVFDYAIRMVTPPEIISIESVQQAFTTGRQYYQQQRDRLEEETGHKYDLVWIMQSNASVGGASMRKRVFVTYSRIPFGVEYAQPERVARFGDAIRDLEGLSLTPSKQPYRRPPTWWSGIRRAPDGVDGHFSIKSSPWFSELMIQARKINQPWLPGEGVAAVVKRLYEAGETLPHEWERRIDKIKAKDFNLGINQTSMWNPDKMGHVVTGSGPALSVHYKEPRLLTHRECFRLQGFPDTWRLWAVRDYKKLTLCPGKGVPVDAGRWLGTWVYESLNGSRGTVLGETIGERERKIDITHAYKWTVEHDAPWRYSDHSAHNLASMREHSTTS